MTRVKGFAPWQPRSKTLPVLSDIESILDEYRAHLPLTIRQIFYRLVARGYPKTEKFYQNTVVEVCGRARRSGRIPFSAIRDDGVSERGGEALCYSNPQEYYDTHNELGNHYEISWHNDQPAFVAVLCEAAGMLPMLARAVEDYRVPVASSSGFDSLSVKHDLYQDAVLRAEEHGQRTMLLHLGDHDPSGISVFESLSEDLEAFCRDEGWSGLIELRRVAITPEQIASLGIEPKPDDVKPTDSRSKAFLARGLEPAAQLEAMPPDQLVSEIRQASRRNRTGYGSSEGFPRTGAARAGRSTGQARYSQQGTTRSLQRLIAPLLTH